MMKYAEIIDDETKQCHVGIGTDESFYKSLGMELLDVEQGADGNWYLSGYAPAAPEKTYTEKRREEYPPIGDQLDMMYWDKLNNTTKWSDLITEIKRKYPKDETTQNTETSSDTSD